MTDPLLLVTGFGPYEDVEENPSGRLVERLDLDPPAGVEIAARILPVSFRGSTTGPSYTQAVCSPAQVTWNVRPDCAKLDIHSLHRWAADGNVFNETKSHGVRQLVTAPELLSPIE